MNDSQFAPVVNRLLGDGVTATAHSAARFAIWWHDLNMLRNSALNAAAGLHVVTNTAGGPGNSICYVTWWDVGEFNVVAGAGVAGHTRWTFQIAMHEATGVVQFRYGPMPAFATSSSTTLGSHAAIVGYSRGRIGGFGGVNSTNPQNRDLSLEGTFTTQVEGARGHVALTALASPNAGGVQYGGRMYAGQTLTWNAANLPPGAILGAQLLDTGASRPGLQLPGITAPGCMLSTTTGAYLWEVFVLPGPTATGTVPFVVPPGFLGAQVHAQFVVLDGLFGGPDLITAASNAVAHTIGLN
jgi:hypothetical protein